MRFWNLAFLGVGLYGGFGLVQQKTEEPLHTLVIYGNLNGSLAPCGCTSPMSGGIVRAGTVLRQMEAVGNAHILLVGGFVTGNGRQDELKAETVAQFAREANAEGLEISADIATLGVGELLEFSQLSGRKEIATNISDTPDTSLASSRKLGPFVVGAYMKAPARPASAVEGNAVTDANVISMLDSEAHLGNNVTVLVTDFDEDKAKLFVERGFSPAILIYRSTTDAPPAPFKHRGTLFVTTGFHGKQVVALTFQGADLKHYTVTDLGPDVPDDKGAAKIYNTYLSDVTKEHLLDSWPRLRTATYAGSDSCRSCHAQAYRIWQHTGHAHALLDLKSKGHALDPDCVSCHVVGLSSTSGYRSQALTPQLAEVGCESCHGPAGAHVRSPKLASLKKASFATCDPCHTPDNSPAFNVKKFWPKIRH